MAIFRRYVEDLLPLVPTILRRGRRNAIQALVRVYYEGMDALAEALEEYVDEWPIDTAPGWVLDAHWLPYHNLQRNGLDDAGCVRYIHAKRLLNRSWGSAHQAIGVFRTLLPAASFEFAYFPPKSWVVTVTGVTMAEAALALKFMEKKPSPEGGGFSVAGDNGMGVIVDVEALNFSSVHGAVTITGWYGSVYGAGGGVQAGWAHMGNV